MSAGSNSSDADGKHLHALSFAQLLQESLAAVLEAYRIAIGVHLGGGLDELTLPLLRRRPVPVASFWEYREESGAHRAERKRQELVFPLPTSGFALGTNP